MRRIRGPVRRFSQFSMKLHVITISMMRRIDRKEIIVQEDEFFENVSSLDDGELTF